MLTTMTEEDWTILSCRVPQEGVSRTLGLPLAPALPGPALRNPLILDGSVDGVERSLFEQHLPETLHKGSQALFRHHRD